MHVHQAGIQISSLWLGTIENDLNYSVLLWLWLERCKHVCKSIEIYHHYNLLSALFRILFFVLVSWKTDKSEYGRFYPVYQEPSFFQSSPPQSRYKWKINRMPWFSIKNSGIREEIVWILAIIFGVCWKRDSSMVCPIRVS